MATEGAYPETWGPARYGDPCRECGLAWSYTADDAVGMVLGTADDYETIIGSADGSLRHPDLGWTLGAYVCHVADNLHVWAQWLAAAALAGETHVPGYDQTLLGEARAYNRVPVQGALWQLRQAAESWHQAVDLARPRHVVLDHETRGPISADDVVCGNAHDAYHHGWDIGRIVNYGAAEGANQRVEGPSGA
jgi:hypothetical protein